MAPLSGPAGWVLVDSRAVCTVCGRAAEPVTPDRWRHAPDAPPIRESRWLEPVTPASLAEVSSYEEFGQRHPWAVRADFAGPTVTSVAEWEEGAARLAAYADRLDAERRRSELDGNPLLHLFGKLVEPTGPLPGRAAGPLSPGLAQILDLPQRRRELAALFAWAVPGDEALSALGRYGPLVESGAGMGYWAAHLQSRGVDVVAYDVDPPGSGAANEFHPTDHPPWTTVHRATGPTAVRRHPDRTLFLCWPPLEHDAAGYGAVRAYRGETLLYVGDPGGGTGTVRLHRELARNWTVVDEVPLPRWPRLVDRLTVYRRNPERLPITERDHCYECGRFVPTGTLGRCDACFTARPPALALQVGPHRAEYPNEALAAMPAALRFALLDSPNRVRDRMDDRSS